MIVGCSKFYMQIQTSSTIHLYKNYAKMTEKWHNQASNKKTVTGKVWCLVFIDCFIASANKFNIYRQCRNMVFILQYQNVQNKCQLPEKSRTKHRFNHIQWCSLPFPRLHLPFLTVFLFGQWLYITKNYPVIATWPFK